jgi:zinc protease
VLGQLITVERPWPPVVSILVVLPRGSAFDAPGREGEAALTWEAALRGTATRDRLALAQELAQLGAEMDAEVDKLAVTIRGEVLAEQTEPFLALLAEVVHHPRFDEAEVSRVRAEMGARLAQIEEDDAALVEDAIGRYAYRGSSLGRPTLGTAAGLASLKAGDLRRRHEADLRGGAWIVGIAGPLAADAARRLVERHLGPLGAVVRPPALPRPPELSGRRLLLLDRARRPQAQVALALASPGPEHRDAPALLLAQTVLAGPFTSRLVHDLRELRGWSYSAWSDTWALPEASLWLLGWAPATERLSDSLDLVVGLVEELSRRGVTEREISFARSYLCGAHRLSLESGAAEVEARVRAALFGLPADYIDRFESRLQAIPPAQVRAALRRHLNPTHMVAVATGPAARLGARLALGSAAFAVESIAVGGRPEETRLAGRIGTAPVGEEVPPPSTYGQEGTTQVGPEDLGEEEEPGLPGAATAVEAEAIEEIDGDEEPAADDPDEGGDDGDSGGNGDQGRQAGAQAGGLP